MNEAYVLSFVQNALMITLILAAPVLIASLLVGILVSLFQAATQINEVTLTFIPKIIAISLVLALLGSWMGQQMLAFTTQTLSNLANLPR